MSLSTCFARQSVALRQSILPAAIPSAAYSVSSYSTPKRFTQSLASHAKLPRSSFLPTRTYSPRASATSVPCSFRGIQSRNFSSSRPARQDDESAEAERELDDGEKNIHDILTREFQPTQLRVQDVSGGCGSFYAIIIVSSKFKGIPTVKAHRMVNEALKDVIAGIHGLQLRTMPADE